MKRQPILHRISALWMVVTLHFNRIAHNKPKICLCACVRASKQFSRIERKQSASREKKKTFHNLLSWNSNEIEWDHDLWMKWKHRALKWMRCTMMSLAVSRLKISNAKWKNWFEIYSRAFLCVSKRGEFQMESTTTRNGHEKFVSVCTMAPKHTNWNNCLTTWKQPNEWVLFLSPEKKTTKKWIEK